MELAAKATSFEEIQSWREQYRQEMNCQIIHDSLHNRPGWSLEYSLIVGGVSVGLLSGLRGLVGGDRGIEGRDPELCPQLGRRIHLAEKYLDVATKHLGSVPGVVLCLWEPLRGGHQRSWSGRVG